MSHENKSIHIPVLAQEILSGLAIQKNDIVLDGTVGFAGHSKLILDQLYSQGHLYAIDKDIVAINFCKKFFLGKNNVSLIHDSFSNFPKHLQKIPNKYLLDLGTSSFQLDSSKRGFSFKNQEPLHMNMNPKHTKLLAKDILNTYNFQQLSNVFFYYGELFQNKHLCNAIIEERKKNPLENTNQLTNLIKKSYRITSYRKFHKLCSQVFQALRIEVNNELDELKCFLESIKVSAPINSIIGIISFHSLEDRIVKFFIRDHSKSFIPLHKKVLTPTPQELSLNPRSKSAKARLFKRV